MKEKPFNFQTAFKFLCSLCFTDCSKGERVQQVSYRKKKINKRIKTDSNADRSFRRKLAGEKHIKLFRVTEYSCEN